MIKEQKLPSDIVDEISRLASDKMDDISYQIDGIIRDALDNFEYDLRDQSFEFNPFEDDDFERPSPNQQVKDTQAKIEEKATYIVDSDVLKRLVYAAYCLNLPDRLHPELRSDLASDIQRVIDLSEPLTEAETAYLQNRFVKGMVYRVETSDPLLATVQGAKVVYLNRAENGSHIVRLEGQDVTLYVDSYELVEV